MKQAVRAGGMVDIPSTREIHEVVNGSVLHAMGSWRDKFRVEYRTFVEQFFVDAGGNLNTNEYNNPNSNNQGNASVGPSAGFIWSVMRITITAPTGATGTVGIYQNGNQPTNIVDPGAVPTYVRLWGKNQFVMRGNETVLLVGSGLVASSIITMTGQAIEVPLDMIAELLL